MPAHKQLSRTAAAAAVLSATALVLSVSAPAQATPRQPAPKFLSPGELPPHPASAWSAAPVTAGLPEHPVFCFENGVLPTRGASHREYWTEYDTSAMQLVFKAKNKAKARQLAAKLRASVRNCAADFEAKIPGASAEWKSYGHICAEDGARVYGVATSVPESENGIGLFGIGRDGRTVTIVKWSQMGTFEHAEVGAFKKTTARAVNKLYR